MSIRESVRIASCALILATPSFAATVPPQARALFERHVQASGGRAAFLADSGWHAIGQLTDSGLEGRTDLWAARPARLARSERVGTLRARVGTDGRSAWSTDLTSRQVTPLEGEDRDAFIGEAWFQSERWAEEQTDARRVTLGSSAFVGDRVLQAVEVTPPIGPAKVLWFDDRTGLLSRLTHLRDQHRWDETYSAWRTMAGRKRPTRMTSGDPRFAAGFREVRIDSVVAWIPNDTLFAPPASRLRPVTWLKAKGVARLPFRYRGGHVWLRASVNGQPPADFILDTGCSLSAFDEAFARKAGLVLEGDLVVQGVGGYDTGGFARVRSVRVLAGDGDGVEVRDLQVAVVELQQEMQTFEWDKPAGLLGYDFLSRFVVEIDFDHSLVTLHDPATYQHRGGGEAIPMELRNNIPTVEVTLERACTGRFIVDVGNAFVLAVHSDQVEKCGLFGRQRPKLDQWGGGIGGGFPVTVCRLDSVRIGPFTWAEPIAGLTTYRRGGVGSTEVQGNIGTSVLDRFHCTFDYARSTLWLEPSAKHAERERYSRSGLFVTRLSGRVVVGGVVRRSPAEDAGLRPRDVIKSVNGRAIERFTQEELERVLHAGDIGSIVRVTYERDLHDHDAELTLADVL